MGSGAQQSPDAEVPRLAPLLEGEAGLVGEACSALSSHAPVYIEDLKLGERYRISGSDFTLQIVEAGPDPKQALLLMYPLSKSLAGPAVIVSSVAQGHPEHAVLQAVDAALKDGEGLVNGVLRCVTTAFLIHVMPTSVIGHTISMLGDAVRAMRASAEARERASAEAGREPASAAKLRSWASARDAAHRARRPDETARASRERAGGPTVPEVPVRARRPDETVRATRVRPGNPTAPDVPVPHPGSDGPRSRKKWRVNPSDESPARPGREQPARPSVGSPSSPTPSTFHRPTRPSGPSHPGQGGRL